MQQVWVFSHYAKQPPSNSVRYHNWGKNLLEHGCSMTIFCSSAEHASRNNRITDGSLFRTEVCDGITYVYIRTRSYTGNGKERILNILDYYRNIFRVVCHFDRPDCIIAVNPHPLAPRAGIKVAKKLGVPCILDVVDFWPQSAVEYGGYNPKSPLLRILYQIEKWMYRKSDAVIFSMEGGPQYIADHSWGSEIDPEKLFYINMGVDLPTFDRNAAIPSLEDPDLLRDDLFKIVYSGSVRQANNLKPICDAAKEIQRRGYTNIRFMIHGAGNQIEELTQYCAEQKIDMIHFYGVIQKSQIPYLLSHADVCLLSFMNTPTKKYGGSQQKTFEYYASGKPVLSDWNSGYNLIRQYNCGIVTQTQEPDEIADAVLKLYHMTPEARAEMGRNARRIAEDFSQPKLTEQLLKVLEKVQARKEEGK